MMNSDNSNVNSNVNDSNVNDGVEEAIAQVVAQTAAPVLASASKKTEQLLTKELFAAYRAEDRRVEAAKEAYEAALKARSEACRAIHENIGSGPFYLNGGEKWKIVVRGETFFFRGKSDKKTGIVVVEE